MTLIQGRLKQKQYWIGFGWMFVGSCVMVINWSDWINVSNLYWMNKKSKSHLQNSLRQKSLIFNESVHVMFGYVQYCCLENFDCWLVSLFWAAWLIMVLYFCSCNSMAPHEFSKNFNTQKKTAAIIIKTVLRLSHGSYSAQTTSYATHPSIICTSYLSGLRGSWGQSSLTEDERRGLPWAGLTLGGSAIYCMTNTETNSHSCSLWQLWAI